MLAGFRISRLPCWSVRIVGNGLSEVVLGHRRRYDFLEKIGTYDDLIGKFCGPVNHKRPATLLNSGINPGFDSKKSKTTGRRPW